MKKTLAAVLLFACAGALLAQGPADKAKPAPAPAKQPAAAAPAAAPAPGAQPAPAAEKKPAPAAKQPAKQAEEPEESIVMIDDKAEPEGKAAAPAEESAPDRNGIPESYGPCKGVATDAGRTILIFENPDSGEISFVHVVFGKTGVTWRLLDTIRRQGTEVVSGGDLE